ncbi:DUF262 domain-containing protein [Rhizobium oryzicola]|uniref:DUF262 domain-containing protein n=1 Tax=Rhizobium oryzicola TaxID=1232668 RepID=A0ABT8SRB8_9HYPH|nr:DUF262 domain-containing protein [Rhizobium oryzicola]MDO1580965.1 DUF262 domain-containing protein [Rhizobium oryzicola]
MTEQSIISDDMTLKRLFQDFYRVPDYQREYVWGETNPKGEGGEEVDQFLMDIYSEYENATKDAAPEYFIGTIVVCMGKDDVFELVDGQQRTTTAYLTLCALRDALVELGQSLPEELKGQIASSTVDWQGESIARYRLELQYEDSGGVLVQYAEGNGATADRQSTRSIRNIGNAYRVIREFITSTLKNDPINIRRFHGYLTNKVKIIRIQTPTIAKALKIFETINDRGVGLDAMDLLKNLLFMNAKEAEYSKLKDVWKQLTGEIYAANEKPLRFLRYYLMATFDVDSTQREELIYDWFQKNENLTKHASEPLTFAHRLLEAARAYRRFTTGMNASGGIERGLVNTRTLGGKSIKQHFIILMAGRHLSPTNFTTLCDEVEKTMFVWLMSGTAGKEYERRIVDAAHELRAVTDENFDDFIQRHFKKERAGLAILFRQRLLSLRVGDTRQFRLRYLLAKLTQYVDLQAYGPSQGRDNLDDYFSGGNDIEHILPDHGDPDAITEFGEGGTDQLIIQRLGNLLLIEKSINRAIQNGKYSDKIKIYPQSKYLLTRCQADKASGQVGVADKITKAVDGLDVFPVWNRDAIEKRQAFLARLASRVWDTADEQAVAQT